MMAPRKQFKKRQPLKWSLRASSKRRMLLRLFVVLLTLSFALLRLGAEVPQEEPSLDLQYPKTIDIEGQTYILFSIPMSKAALWYYDSYFVQKQLAERLGVQIEGYEDALRNCISDADAVSAKAIRLESTLAWYESVSKLRTVFVIVLGSYAVVATIVIAVLFILR
jgi:hypothetical protein